MTMKLTIAVTSLVASPAFTVGQATPNYTSPLGVEIYNPAQLFNASGTWSLMSRAGNTLYISGTAPKQASLLTLSLWLAKSFG